MPRHILDESRIHPAIRSTVAGNHRRTVQEVVDAVAAHRVVVVGMHGNPFVRKARRALDAAGIAHHDIDYGSYLRDWRRRTALKMWTGWATFPMVFVDGTLIGGADDTAARIADGSLGKA